MTFAELYAQHGADLEDFWGRRQNYPRSVRKTHLFGCPLHLESNQQSSLQALSYSLPLYSAAPPINQPPLRLQLVVREGRQDPGPPPDDLFPVIQYSGDAGWLMLHIAAWGTIFVDMAAGEAKGVITPQLAARPELVSRCLLNTILNNLAMGQGFAMLHATGLWWEDRLLLLMAPHNTGKSTTALRLALGGFPLVSDSQLYLSPFSDQLQVTGFPLGKAKLRRDMLPAFPQFHYLLSTEKAWVRGETKYVLDLAKVDPRLVIKEAVTPSKIIWCFLSRSGERETTVMPASLAEARPIIFQNSIFYDSNTVWQKNWAQIERAIEIASFYHLAIGTENAGILWAAQQLFNR